MIQYPDKAATINIFMSNFSFTEFCDCVADRISDDYRTYRDCCQYDSTLEKMDCDDVIQWLIDDFAREVGFCLEEDLNDIWNEDEEDVENDEEEGEEKA